MKEFIVPEKKEIKIGDVTCLIDMSSKDGFISPIEITWTIKSNEIPYEPSLKDWKYVLEQCLDEKWSIFHQLNDIAEAMYDYVCFGGIDENSLRNVRVDAINFEREAHIASIIERYILSNKDTEEVKQYLEECEKDKVARDGLRNFFGHKGIL